MDEKRLFIKRLFGFEVKLDERYRRAFTIWMFFYAGFAAFQPAALWLADREGISAKVTAMDSIFFYLLHPTSLLIVIILAAAVRYYFSVGAFINQRKVFGEELPLSHFTFQLTNMIILFSWLVLIFVPALMLAVVFDWRLSDAIQWSEKVAVFLQDLPAQFDQIPTLVNFPPLLAYFSADLVTGLVFYWWHRLGHSWRPLWLLFHRGHHIPERLSETNSVFIDDAGLGFIVRRIVMAFFMGLVAKLFTHDAATIVEILCVMTFIRIVYGLALGPISHSIVYYQWAIKRKWIRWGFFILGSGPYHLMHHSSKKEHQMVNLGGLFLWWDHVFGTYAKLEKETPITGLTDCPPLHMNPFRIIFGGIVEMVQEFRLNHGWKDRFLVLFGPTSYVPPVRYLYLKKAHV